MAPDLADRSIVGLLVPFSSCLPSWASHPGLLGEVPVCSELRSERSSQLCLVLDLTGKMHIELGGLGESSAWFGKRGS